jgi:aminoglycoside 3-N-acetyltransferase
MAGLTTADILSGLRSLGVAAGDLLIVHSSLRSLGHVEGGADPVARALVDSVSPGGTLFVPTFNYARLPYDPATTPSLAGAISEAVRLLPGSRRSLQPTHPWSAVGPAAGEILTAHDERATPFGPDSPVWRLWERDAKVLLLGVDQRANSMIHVAEELLRLPYLDRTRVTKVVRDGGRIDEVVVRRPGHSGGFNKLDAPLRSASAVREVQIGEAMVRLMQSRRLVSTAQAMLRHDPTALLCDDTNCAVCVEARAMLAKAEPPRG